MKNKIQKTVMFLFLLWVVVFIETCLVGDAFEVGSENKRKSLYDNLHKHIQHEFSSCDTKERIVKSLTKIVLAFPFILSSKETLKNCVMTQM